MHAQFVAGDRAILTRRFYGESMLWELPKDARDVKELAQLANVFSGHQRDSTGALLPKTPEGLHDAYETLRTQHPEDFRVPDNDVITWHRREAEASEEPNSGALSCFI
jgi:hypothetical protein